MHVCWVFLGIADLARNSTALIAIGYKSETSRQLQVVLVFRFNSVKY